MFLTYFIFIVASIDLALRIVFAVKAKTMTHLWPSLLAFPFFFCMFVGILSGGSALHNASKEYDLYREGCYYLTSHGSWTEVSRQTYLFVLVSEIIGFSCFAICFVFSIICNRKQKTSRQKGESL